MFLDTATPIYKPSSTKAINQKQRNNEPSAFQQNKTVFNSVMNQNIIKSFIKVIIKKL